MIQADLRMVERPGAARAEAPTEQIRTVAKRRAQDWTPVLVVAILAVSFFLNVFRSIQAIDLTSDESTYAIESVAMHRTGVTLWNGSPFYVHPPLYFAIEGLYFGAQGIGNDPLFDRLVSAPYHTGQALVPANSPATGYPLIRAIEVGRYLNALYGALLSVLVFLFGRSLLGLPLGLLASTLFTLDPYVVWRNHFNYLEPLLTLFGMASLYAYYAAQKRDRAGRRMPFLILSGIFLGLAVLTKELAFLYFVAILVYALLFRRNRLVQTLIPLGVGLALYSIFPIWTALSGHFDIWWQTKTWLFRRISGQQLDSGIGRPGVSLVETVASNLPDYWPWFIALGVAFLLALTFIYLYLARGARDLAAELLSASIVGMYGFFLFVRLLGGVINEQYFYSMMPVVALSIGYAVLSVLQRAGWLYSAPAALEPAKIAPGRAAATSGPGVPSARVTHADGAANGWRWLRADPNETRLLETIPRVPASTPSEPEVETPPGHSVPVTQRRHGASRRLGWIALGIIGVLLAYNLASWVLRYCLSTDDSYISVESRLAPGLPPGAQVVGRDILDMFLMPKQRVYAYAYLDLIAAEIDPGYVAQQKIPYTVLNDQYLAQHYGGANERYYDWVKANGKQIAAFTGRRYTTSVYEIDYSKPVQSFGADSLGFNHPARSSSSEDAATLGPERAFDGLITTRWASKESPNEWISVDLGARTAVSRVELSWEQAYAKSYELQVSDDGANWTTFYKTDKGKGGTETIQAKATGRYVRLLLTQRGTPYGYSLWEFAIYP